MSTVFRDLCAELVEQLQRAINDYGFSLEGESALMFRARKELAQPEREGPSLAEVDELAAPTPEAAPVATDPESAAKARDIDPKFHDVIRQVDALMEASADLPDFSSAADNQVIVSCPETCWVQIRRISDGKMIYDNHRKGTLVIPVGEPPTPPPGPAGGLVEKVAEAIFTAEGDGNTEDWTSEARAAIREVAAWLDRHDCHGPALCLRQEAYRA